MVNPVSGVAFGIQEIIVKNVSSKMQCPTLLLQHLLCSLSIHMLLCHNNNNSKCMRIIKGRMAGILLNHPNKWE